MQQFFIFIFASFAGGILAQSSGGPPPPEVAALIPPTLMDKATGAYNKLTADQKSQASVIAKSLNDQQKQQVRTLLSDPAVQNGNFQGASQSTQATALQLCQSLSPQQQQGVISLGIGLGLQLPQQLCTPGGNNGSSSTSAPGPSGAGNDLHPRCCMWAQMGECDRNPFWMKPNCPKACGTPGATVENAANKPSNPQTNCGSSGTGPGNTGPGNTGPGNAGPGNTGPGNTGPGGAQPGATRPGQSGNTPTCYDVTEMCAFWAYVGECQRNANWMRANCLRSCQACAGGSGNPGTGTGNPGTGTGNPGTGAGSPGSGAGSPGSGAGSPGSSPGPTGAGGV